MSYIVAVDSGGTFCDCVITDENGKVTRAKSSSTPPNFDEGVYNSVAEAAKVLDRPLSEILNETILFAHGTTVATNVLVSHTGAKISLLTTKGHEDVMLIGRTAQKVAGLTESEIINVARLTKATPLVPRPLIFGIDERVDRAGRVVVPLNLERSPELIAKLKAENVEAIAVCFLWSFLNPSHEQAVKKWLNEELPGVNVTISSDIAPVIREYERTSTTVMNAYLTPSVERYLDRMRDRLVEAGLKGPVAVMHSSGGLTSVTEASSKGASLLVSGPAGGALGSQALAGRLGLSKVLTTDVGGTSFDVGVIVDGKPGYSEGPIVNKLPLALPVIDVSSIGSGGGSIAWIEKETGVLRVGPRSAGARPGPVCYDMGGSEPTVTDANLVLGRLNPDYFLAGRMKLYPELAFEAIKTCIADKLGISVEEAALSIIDIVDAQMSDLIRKVTVEGGQDPAGFTVFAFGGAGGLHCDAFSTSLDCSQVVVPGSAAVFSATGIGGSDAKIVREFSDPQKAPLDLGAWKKQFQNLEDTIVREMKDQRLPIGDISLTRFVHLLFSGQVYTVRVPVTMEDLDASDRGAAITDRFVDMYESRYGKGTAYVQAGVEATSISIEAVAGLPKPVHQKQSLGDPDASEAFKGMRGVYLESAEHKTDVSIYAGDKLKPGHRLEGPALIEAEDTTVLVQAGHTLWIDEYENMRIELK